MSYSNFDTLLNLESSRRQFLPWNYSIFIISTNSIEKSFRLWKLFKFIFLIEILFAFSNYFRNSFVIDKKMFCKFLLWQKSVNFSDLWAGRKTKISSVKIFSAITCTILSRRAAHVCRVGVSIIRRKKATLKTMNLRCYRKTSHVPYSFPILCGFINFLSFYFFVFVLSVLVAWPQTTLRMRDPRWE